MKNHPITLNDSEFIAKINQIVNKHDIQQIIETGTNLGVGSTLVFAKTGLPVTSLECRRDLVEKARNNLINYPNVSVLHAHSLNKESMLEEMQNNFNNHEEMGEEIRRDGGIRFYKREISHRTEYDNILSPLINNTVKQLVFLDSSGGCGFIEFNEFMKMPKRFLLNKTLVMDDVDHVKHFESFNKLVKMGYDPQKSDSKRWAWCTF